MVKLSTIGDWNKLFDFGTSGAGEDGGTYDVLGASWNSNSGVVEIQSYTALNASYTGNAQYSQQPFLTPAVGQWYHIAMVMLNTDPTLFTTGNWLIYVNGLNASSATGLNMPLPVYRLFSFLGAGSWSDAPDPMVLDAFRIYDYALSATTVQQLAAAYNLNEAAAPPLNSTEDAQALAAVPFPPVLSASFSVNPATLVGTPVLNYAWVANLSANAFGCRAAERRTASVVHRLRHGERALTRSEC